MKTLLTLSLPEPLRKTSSLSVPSDAVQERVEDLLLREKDGELSPAEKSELDRYLQLEHLMRLAKARARDFLPNE